MAWLLILKPELPIPISKAMAFCKLHLAQSTFCEFLIKIMFPKEFVKIQIQKIPKIVLRILSPDTRKTLDIVL